MVGAKNLRKKHASHNNTSQYLFELFEFQQFFKKMSTNSIEKALSDGNDTEASCETKKIESETETNRSKKQLFYIIFLTSFIIACLILAIVHGKSILVFIFTYTNKIDLNNGEHIGIIIGVLFVTCIINMFLPLRNKSAIIIGFLTQKLIKNIHLAIFISILIDVIITMIYGCIQWILTKLWFKKWIKNYFKNSKSYQSTMNAIDYIPIQSQILLRLVTSNGIGNWLCSSLNVSFKTYNIAQLPIVTMSSMLFVPFGACLGRISTDLNVESYDQASIFNLDNLWEHHKMMFIMWICYMIIMIAVILSVSKGLKTHVQNNKKSKKLKTNNKWQHLTL